jgi:hypothetical protein
VDSSCADNTTPFGGVRAKPQRPAVNGTEVHPSSQRTRPECSGHGPTAVFATLPDGVVDGVDNDVPNDVPNARSA